MHKQRKHSGKWLMLGLLLGVGGCSEKDRDCLTRVARKIAEKAENLATGAHGQLMAGMKVAPSSWEEMTLDLRLAARLRWDKALTEQNEMQIRVKDGVVELKGTVQDLDKRRRAVELAETTVGVEKVEDNLEVPEKAP